MPVPLPVGRQPRPCPGVRVFHARVVLQAVHVEVAVDVDDGDCESRRVVMPGGGVSGGSG